MSLAAGGPLLALGVVLLAGLLAGGLARRLRLPTLTGYILAGIAIGTQGADLLPDGALRAVEGPINDFAIAAVLFFLGGRIRLDELRRGTRPLLTLSITEALITFSAVAGAALLVLPRRDGALLLAVLALEIAPATTVSVLNEYGARGRVTDLIRLLTALSNFWVVLLFDAALLVLAFAQGGDVGPLSLLAKQGGSLTIGLLAAHLLIFLQERARWTSAAAPLLAVTIATIGVCKGLEVPHMLAFLVAGVVVANRSRLMEPIEQAVETFAQPALILFFVFAGMHFDFALLGREWLAVSLYVLVRTAARIFGTRIGLRLSGLRFGTLSGVQPPLGLGLLCQAGAAIALAQYAKSYDAQLGASLLNTVLGAVLIFELIGPVLLKHVVVAAGEVSLAQLSTHTQRAEALSPLRVLGRTLRGRALRRRATPDVVPVERIMRRAPASLAEGAGLDELLRFANQSRFDVFPVTDGAGRLTGCIRMRDLEEVAYDPSTARLVTALDIATLDLAEAALPAGATLADAEAFFRRYAENAAPVIAAVGDARLVGILERSEVLHLRRALRVRGTQGDETSD